MSFSQLTSCSDEPLETEPDGTLVARVQAGDATAFEGLVVRHSSRVYSKIIAITRNPHEAQDALQETFLKAFQRICQFEGRSEFAGWLTIIAGNTALQRLRDQKRFHPLDDDSGETKIRPRELWIRAANPEQLYSQAERRALVSRGLKKVPSKYRTVLVLRDLEQRSTEDVAAILGLGTSAVKARLFRARLMLRRALSPDLE